MALRTSWATLALAFLATGCGGGSSNGNATGGGGAPAPTPTPTPTPTTAGCTIQFQNQTCTPGTLITAISNPPPADPPPLPTFTDPAQWETAEYNQNFGLDQIGASLAYSKGANGTGIVIAVIDVGNQTNHPEVFGRIEQATASTYDVRGDIVEGDNRWAHGLQCATLAMATKNDNGAHGVAIGARLLYIRADAGFSFPSLDDFPLHTPTDLAQSVDYAAANGASVISLSLGVTSDPTGVLFNAIKRATDSGVVIVTALGNYFDGRADSQKNIVLLPAAFGADPAFQGRLVLAGASDSQGDIAFFSPRAGAAGQEAFLLAPGANMLVPGGGGGRTIILAPGNTTSFLRDSGTSFAAPHIAGAIAVIMQGKGVSAVEALQMLYDNAVDLGPIGNDPTNGRGRIDLRPIFN